jgi:CheY-like chemotaxis protein
LISNAGKFSMNGNVLVKIDVVTVLNESEHHTDIDTKKANSSRQWFRVSVSNTSRSRVRAQSILSNDAMECVDGDTEHRNMFGLLDQTTRTCGGAGLGMYTLSRRIAALGGKCGHSVVFNPAPSEYSSSSGSGSTGENVEVWFALPVVVPDVWENEIMAIEQSCDRSSIGLQNMNTSTVANPLQQQQIDTPKHVSPEVKVPVTDQKVVECVIEDTTRKDTILVVDDSMVVLKATRRALQLEGYEVETAANGQQACDLVIKDRRIYTAILMDVEMPVMGGIEATRTIREKEQHFLFTSGSSKRSLLTIIGVSASADETVRNQCLQGGMNVFIPKPYTMRQFHEVMRQLKKGDEMV